MRVSWRHMLAASGLAALTAGGVTASGQQAGGCCAPPVYTPPPPPAGCCTPPRDLVVRVPGVSIATPSVSVGVTGASVAVAGATATTMASGIVTSGASAGGSTFFYGGGGGGYSVGATPPSTITGLSVSGFETRMVEEEHSEVEEYCIDRVREERVTRPVQAVCVDDRGLEHPASRVDDETAVDSRYNGEIYRCAAGSRLKVSTGAMDGGAATFVSAETLTCEKGEALWHSPGGKLSCRPQAPERNCNERTLLRRHGPGVKLVEISTPKPYCEPAQRVRITKVSKEVRSPVALPPGNLILDGGVGNSY